MGNNSVGACARKGHKTQKLASAIGPYTDGMWSPAILTDCMSGCGERRLDPVPGEAQFFSTYAEAAEAADAHVTD